jgi:hypothetical protein
MCFNTQDPVPCSAKKPLGPYWDRCLTWLPVSGGDDAALEFGQCLYSYLKCAEYEATGRMSCNEQ